jgi:hypothetical protein
MWAMTPPLKESVLTKFKIPPISSSFCFHCRRLGIQFSLGFRRIYLIMFASLMARSITSISKIDSCKSITNL